MNKLGSVGEMKEMDQEKIGKFIKEIRLKNHLTQNELAKRYGVTYQAVSKWENGKNIPDITLLKQMSQDFKVDIETILEGQMPRKKAKQSKKKTIILVVLLLLVMILFSFGIFFYLNQKSEFEFKTLSTECNQFRISGSIAYNERKSSIYISNINYCGGEDNTLYQKMECNLVEINQNTETKIGQIRKKFEEGSKLEAYLQEIQFHIDNYERTCKQYSENSLYLEINATDFAGKITSYQVPLSLNGSCFDE